MSYNTIAESSYSLAAPFTIPGDVPSDAALVAVADHVQSQHAHEAVLRHRSSMGSMYDQEMWGVATPQQHRCHEPCGYDDDDAKLHELEEQFLNFEECADEDILPFGDDAHLAEYPITHTNISSTHEIPLLATQITAVSVIHASPTTRDLYPFPPSTSFATYHTPEGLVPPYLSAAAVYENAASSAATSASPMTSSTSRQKRARVDDEEEDEDDLPLWKKIRESERDEVIALHSAFDEEAVSASDELLEEEDEYLQEEEPEVEEVVDDDGQSTQAEEVEEEEAAAVEADDGSEADGEEAQPAPRPKRSRRTKDKVLETTRRLPRGVPCPVQGCTKAAFNPYDRVGNRNHIVTHLERAAVIECPWPVCEDTRDSQNLMIHHITDVHIGFPYICLLDDRCTWGSTKSQWQTQHMQRDCKYRPV
ncbi:hypothetical protein VTO73DRAFT_11258 [Trametes versicolor]